MFSPLFKEGQIFSLLIQISVLCQWNSIPV